MGADANAGHPDFLDSAFGRGRLSQFNENLQIRPMTNPRHCEN